MVTKTKPTGNKVILSKRVLKAQNLRVPRPMGVTQYMYEWHKTKNPDHWAQIKRVMIQQWLLSQGTVCGKDYTVSTLANFLGIDEEEIRIQMRDNFLSTKIWDQDNQKALVESLIGQQIVWNLEDRMAIDKQVSILQQAQGGKYKPFISTELQNILRLKTTSTSNLMGVVKNLTQTGTINIFNDNSHNEQQINIVTPEQVRQMVDDNMKTLSADQNLAALEARYDAQALPEVVATEQQGIDTSKEGITKNIDMKELDNILQLPSTVHKNKDHHENRREIAMGIDQDARDPELDQYDPDIDLTLP